MTLYYFINKITDIKFDYFSKKCYVQSVNYREIECACYDIITEHFNLRRDINRATHFPYVNNIINQKNIILLDIDDSFDFYKIDIKYMERLLKLTLLNYDINN